MSPRMPTPTEIGSVSEDIYRITWSDGHHSTYTWRLLRAGCPCARCKGEWEQFGHSCGPRTFQRISVPRA